MRNARSLAIALDGHKLLTIVQIIRHNLPVTERARTEFAATAASMASGQTSLIDGARRLCGLGYALNLDVSQDADFRTMVGFSSETDALPAGPERANWHSAALAEKDSEIAAVEEQWGEEVRAAAVRLAARFVQAI